MVTVAVATAGVVAQQHVRRFLSEDHDQSLGGLLRVGPYAGPVDGVRKKFAAVAAVRIPQVHDASRSEDRGADPQFTHRVGSPAEASPIIPSVATTMTTR